MTSVPHLLTPISLQKTQVSFASFSYVYFCELFKKKKLTALFLNVRQILQVNLEQHCPLFLDSSELPSTSAQDTPCMAAIPTVFHFKLSTVFFYNVGILTHALSCRYAVRHICG